MAPPTVIATGMSSGLGFEMMKQLLADPSKPYRFILGVRDVARTQAALDELKYDTAKFDVTLFPCDFSNLGNVRTFAREALAKLGDAKLDYLLMNHGMVKDAKAPNGPHGSPWCETLVVNHQSQHYLMHLLHDKIVSSHARVVMVASSVITMMPTTAEHVASLRSTLTAGSGADFFPVYPFSKFVQLAGALHWRRQLDGKAIVVAVDPGIVAGTGLARNVDKSPADGHPEARDVPTGARSLLAALYREDVPKAPEAIFLDSKGNWWDPHEKYPLALDTKLQDSWCPSQAELEKEAKL